MIEEFVSKTKNPRLRHDFGGQARLRQDFGEQAHRLAPMFLIGVFADEDSSWNQYCRQYQETTQQLFQCSSFARICTLRSAPPHGGIKRPHVVYDSIMDTCGFAPAIVNSRLAGGAPCRLAKKRFMSNNGSLNRCASLRFVSLIC